MIRQSIKRKFIAYLVVLIIFISFAFLAFLLAANKSRPVFFVGLSIALFSIGLGVLFASFLAEKITKPIIDLTKNVSAIRQGDLSHRIAIKTGDEIEDLAEAFNQMANELYESHFALEESKQILEIKVNSRTKELKELAENLEDKVRSRTKELDERLRELERFRQLTVGRELKMIELKKELQRLNEELALAKAATLTKVAPKTTKRRKK